MEEQNNTELETNNDNVTKINASDTQIDKPESIQLKKHEPVELATPKTQSTRKKRQPPPVEKKREYNKRHQERQNLKKSVLESMDEFYSAKLKPKFKKLKDIIRGGGNKPPISPPSAPLQVERHIIQQEPEIIPEPIIHAYKPPISERIMQSNIRQREERNANSEKFRGLFSRK